jgi:hypothetical protein
MTELSSSESKAVLTWERRERGAVSYGASGTRTGDLLGAITGDKVLWSICRLMKPSQETSPASESHSRGGTGTPPSGSAFATSASATRQARLRGSALRIRKPGATSKLPKSA